MGLLGFPKSQWRSFGIGFVLCGVAWTLIFPHLIMPAIGLIIVGILISAFSG